MTKIEVERLNRRVAYLRRNMRRIGLGLQEAADSPRTEVVIGEINSAAQNLKYLLDQDDDRDRS